MQKKYTYNEKHSRQYTTLKVNIESAASIRTIEGFIFFAKIINLSAQREATCMKEV